MSRMIALFLLIACFAIPLPLSAGVDEGDEPTLDVETVDGDSVTLEGLRGKVVLVDFWATWCGPCRKSFPFYEQLVEKYGDRGLVVLAVSVDEQKSDVTKFLEDHPVSFSVALDEGHDLVSRFEPATMPTSYLIDRKGVVRDVHEGFRADDQEELEALVVRLLGK